MPHVITGTGNIVSEFKNFTGKEGQKIASFSLAVSDLGKTMFFNCVAFSRSYSEKQWELLMGQKKGYTIYFEGRLQENEYTDKAGTKKKSLQMVLNRFDFPSRKKDESASSAPSAPQVPIAPVGKPMDDEIPF